MCRPPARPFSAARRAGRRQDFAEGGQKPEGGAKSQEGEHIFKILY